MATASSAKAKKTKKAVKQAKVRKTAGIYTMLKNVLKWLQAFSGTYAFLNIVYWFGIITKIFDKTFLSFLFAPAWSFVGKFYVYNSSGAKDDLDFTGLVAAIILIVMAIILKSLCEYVTDLEEAAKIKDEKRQERANKKMQAKENGTLKQRLSKTEAQKVLNCQFIFLLDISIKQTTGFIQEEPLSPEEIAKIKNNFYNSILNNINMNHINQKGYYRKKLFLIYKNMNYFDEFVFYTKETLNALLHEFSRPTMRIDFYVALCEYRLTDNLKNRLENLDTIDKLGLKNDFVCTSSLRELYELLPKKQFEFISRGVYNLSKNLNVAINEEIYSLRSTV